MIDKYNTRSSICGHKNKAPPKNFKLYFSRACLIHNFPIKSPGTSSLTPAFPLSSFPVPSWRLPAPPAVSAHLLHPQAQDVHMCSASPRCHCAPSGTAASSGSCRISPCCYSRYGGIRAA